MTPIIRLDGVSKRFGSTVALDGVSLDVPAGVVFGLLGENGAGKSTAIRILLGLTDPDAGSAEVLGLDSRRHALEIRRRVGYVAERPTLYDWMTVGEIGWFTSAFYDPAYLENYRRLVREMELETNKPIRALSKGMRAKVSLALAMAHDPELLVLDEPTSGLDAMVRREFLESMVERAASGKTVLLSSHQIVEVERVADYVALLRHGNLVLVQRLDELKAATRLVVVTTSDASARVGWPGEVLDESKRGRQRQLLVRGATDDELEGLRQHAAVQAIEWRTPTLEEIFLAHMAGSPPSADESDLSRAAAEVDQR